MAASAHQWIQMESTGASPPSSRQRADLRYQQDRHASTQEEFNPLEFSLHMKHKVGTMNANRC